MRKTNTLLCLEIIKPFFLLIALIQTKAGPQSSGTPVLVIIKNVIIGVRRDTDYTEAGADSWICRWYILSKLVKLYPSLY